MNSAQAHQTSKHSLFPQHFCASIVTKHEFGVVERGGKGVRYSRSRGKSVMARRFI